MAMMTANAAKDAKLQYLKDKIDKIVVLAGEPTTYAKATTNLGSGSGQRIAEADIASEDMTIGDGPIDGRAITIAEKSGVPVLADGTITYYAWLDTANSTILHYAPTTPKAVTTAGTLIFAAVSYIDRETTAA